MTDSGNKVDIKDVYVGLCAICKKNCKFTWNLELCSEYEEIEYWKGKEK